MRGLCLEMGKSLEWPVCVPFHHKVICLALKFRCLLPKRSLAPSGGVDITGGTIRPAAGINKDVWRTICQRAGLLFPVFLDQIRIGAYCVGTISLKIEFFFSVTTSFVMATCVFSGLVNYLVPV